LCLFVLHFLFVSFRGLDGRNLEFATQPHAFNDLYFHDKKVKGSAQIAELDRLFSYLCLPGQRFPIFHNNI
jgi:hypothetical protein